MGERNFKFGRGIVLNDGAGVINRRNWASVSILIDRLETSIPFFEELIPVNSLLVQDGTTARKFVDSGVTIDKDTQAMAGVGAFTAGGVATFNGTFAGTGVLDEDDMASDSAVKIATQQSIKAYVDTVTANFIENIVEDVSPQLGADLDMNGFDLSIGDNNLNIEYNSAINKLFNLVNLGTGVVVVLLQGTLSVTGNAIFQGNILLSGTIDSVFVGPTAPSAPVSGVPWLDTSVPSSAAGAGTLPVTTITSDTTLTSSEVVVLCDAISSAITVTLPPASTSEGKRYYIKKMDASANDVIVDGNASETIDDGLTAEITSQYESITIVCDGTNWSIL